MRRARMENFARMRNTVTNPQAAASYGKILRHMNRTKSLLLLIPIFAVFFLDTKQAAGQDPSKSGKVLALTVETYDGLTLPAQVIHPGNKDKKMILFINGSTPYDEKGNMGAFWNDQGKMITEKQDFYLRFLDIMSGKGYPVATMAKRSFVYPTKLPRPGFSDLALDIQYFIEELKRSGTLKDEKDLVIVGYSEGSVVSTKVLGLLKKQPYACILLGSADMRCDCSNPRSIEDFYLTDVLRRLKNWTDEQIRIEYDQMCKIQKALLNMDEETFENEYKNSKPFGFGFAMWESFYIDREAGLYDPLPNLLYANIHMLICIGEDDTAMPAVQAKRTFERLKNNGADQVTFRLIEKEVHQYRKYDLFAIMDTWLDSRFRSTGFTLQKSDSITIEKYARANELIEEIQSLSYENGDPAEALNCYQKAVDTEMSDMGTWFSLGVRLVAAGCHDEAYASFARAADPAFAACFASFVWMGHLKDLKKEREVAVVFYRKALDAYPGFPVQHSQWDMLIDKNWIEERIRLAFSNDLITIPKRSR